MPTRTYWQAFPLWMTTAVLVSSLLISGLALLGPVITPVLDRVMAEQAVARVEASR